MMDQTHLGSIHVAVEGRVEESCGDELRIASIHGPVFWCQMHGPYPTHRRGEPPITDAHYLHSLNGLSRDPGTFFADSALFQQTPFITTATPTSLVHCQNVLCVSDNAHDALRQEPGSITHFRISRHPTDSSPPPGP